MLAKKHRLSASEVREVLKKGRSLRGTSISAKYVAAAVPKVAVVISSKLVKKATSRNRLRRIAYVSLKGRLPHVHVVFFINKAEPDFGELSLLCSKLS